VKLKLILTMAIVGVALALPSISSAATPTQDSVSLTQSPAVAGPYNVFQLDATSGPNGENPTGQVQLSEFQQIFDGGPVTCLAVSGNTATLNFVSEFLIGAIITIHVVDDSPDTFSAQFLKRAATDCSPPPEMNVFPLTSGDITVIDAPGAPTSKQQCKNGGWRNFPQFKNEGLCIAFVGHGP
jgi:hypothetical protein